MRGRREVKKRDKKIRLKRFASEMRTAPTAAEAEFRKILLSLLDKRDFVWQQSFVTAKCGYIVDFYVPALMLAFEIDGGYHDQLAQLARDFYRTRWLNKKGVKVVRFKNEEVFNFNLCREQTKNNIELRIAEIKSRNDKKLNGLLSL